VKDLAGAIDYAKRQFSSGSRVYEVRILEIPALHKTAVWLHGPEEIFIPILERAETATAPQAIREDRQFASRVVQAAADKRAPEEGNMPMKTSALGVQAIAQREGRVLHAYRDTRNILTIGVGHTSAAGPPVVVEGMAITAAECDDILSRDLAQFEDAVNAALATPIAQNKLSQNAFDACVSLAFNIGAPGFRGSSVARDINNGDMQGAAEAFLLWDHPPELIGRRRGERAQFLRPDSAAVADAPINAEAPRGSIAWIQMKLNAAGANPKLDVDGDLGPATLAAIKAFQTNRGLVSDGIVGPQTLAALG